MADTTNKELNRPNRDDPDWDTPLNDNFGWIDTAFGGEASISAVAGGDVLTLAQYRNAFLNFNGTITGTARYRIPTGVGGFWVVRNKTTSSGGSHELIIAAVAGTEEVVVPEGQIRTVYADGAGHVRSTNIYGKENEVLFGRDDKSPEGNANFTFNGTDLRVPRIRLDSGSENDPAVRSENATVPTGLFFYGANATKGIGLSTNGADRLSINFEGALGFGSAKDFGVAGQFLKSRGNGTHPIWGDANIRILGDETTNSGNPVSFSGFTAGDYKLIIFVFKNITHNNTSATRTLQIGGSSLDTVVSGQMSDTQQINGMAIIHPASSVGFATTGTNSGSLPFSNGFSCNIDSGSGSVRAGWGGANFDGGRIWILGVY